VVLESVDSIVDDWLDTLADELDVAELWDVTDVGRDAVVVVTIGDSVVMAEICVVGLPAEVIITDEASDGSSVVDMTTSVVEVGISCEVGIVSEVIIVGTEGADCVVGVGAALSV
jgi:hypothetical protein